MGSLSFELVAAKAQRLESIELWYVRLRFLTMIILILTIVVLDLPAIIIRGNLRFENAEIEAAIRYLLI